MTVDFKNRRALVALETDSGIGSILQKNFRGPPSRFGILVSFLHSLNPIGEDAGGLHVVR